MFIDEVVLELKAGSGGNGMVSYRREKYVEFGGPSGGNGGSGGSIIFVGDLGKNTLYDLKYNHHINGIDGEPGKSKGMHGKNALNTYIKVPLGTVVSKLDGTLIGEVLNQGVELVVAAGGKGGRGNIAFATHKNPAPDFAENGDKGEHFKVKVELKVLADVGLIGYPSVGKSTIISVLSNARPKIAAYPFTTLSPNLGVVHHYDQTLVLADLPGLIKNASSGDGLGFKFLRHIERCRYFIHVIDVTRDNPYQDYLDIRKELELYNEKLLLRTELIVLNKIDSIDTNTLDSIKNQFKDKNVVLISALCHTNLDILKDEVFTLYDQSDSIEIEEKEVKVYRNEKEVELFTISVINGVFYLEGDTIKKYFDRTNFDNYSSVMRFARQLRGLGVDDALREKGAKDKDIISVYGFEFEFIDE